jgi:hypothetical protein
VVALISRDQTVGHVSESQGSCSCSALEQADEVGELAGHAGSPAMHHLVSDISTKVEKVLPHQNESVLVDSLREYVGNHFLSVGISLTKIKSRD